MRTSRSEVAITAATIVAILTLNLLEGVAVGLVLSLLKAAVQASSLRTRVREEADEVHLEVSGSATFVRLPQLADTLEAVPADRPLTVHLAEPDKLDRACREALDTFVEQREARGAQVSVRTAEPTRGAAGLTPHHVPPQTTEAGRTRGCDRPPVVQQTRLRRWPRRRRWSPSRRRPRAGGREPCAYRSS